MYIYVARASRTLEHLNFTLTAHRSILSWAFAWLGMVMAKLCCKNLHNIHPRRGKQGENPCMGTLQVGNYEVKGRNEQNYNSSLALGFPFLGFWLCFWLCFWSLGVILVIVLRLTLSGFGLCRWFRRGIGGWRSWTISLSSFRFQKGPGLRHAWLGSYLAYMKLIGWTCTRDPSKKMACI